MPDTTHLEPRGRTWWYIRAFPKALRPKLPMPWTGKAKFMVNLKTDSVGMAQRERPRLGAEFDTLLERARRRELGVEEELLLEEAKDIRHGISGDYDGAVRQELALERAEQIERKYGEDVASQFYKTATGQRDGTGIAEYLKRFQAENPAVPYTQYKREKVINDLAQWRSGLYLESFSRDLCRQFVDEVLATGREPATINGNLTTLNTYFKWLMDRGYLKEGPIHWSKFRRKAGRKAPEADKRAYTDDEMAKLFRGPVKMRPDLLDCATISALTGGRLDEVGRLKVSNIDTKKLTVFLPGSKTEAAPRTIPMHPALKAIFLERLKGKGGDDWVFDELPDRKKDSLSARTSPVSKAFTRFRRQVGVGGLTDETSPVDFHSLRRWSATKMREAGVPKHIVGAVHGWKESGMQGLYTGSADLMRQMREAVGKLKLPG